MMDEDEAERIRASRGDYEIEVSSTEEVGLRQRRAKCDKNPNHLKFIPVKDFNIEHLPSRYRDNLLVKYVRATSDITCRLSVSRISKDRPDTLADSNQPFPFAAFKGKNCTITGTGCVSKVERRAAGWENWHCECEECRDSDTNTPKKKWGEVYIKTVCHVVCDSEEARHTKCQFFYDSHETDIKKALTLTGINFCETDIKGDMCMMEYHTHDMELLDRLEEMLDRWVELRNRLCFKYMCNKAPHFHDSGVGCDTNDDHDLCIIVSHPHGCSKVVSVGAWTRRDVLDQYNLREKVTYSYNTPTCPGSSGAPVIVLYKNITPAFSYHPPPHSQGRPGNDNNSGVGQEFVY